MRVQISLFALGFALLAACDEPAKPAAAPTAPAGSAATSATGATVAAGGPAAPCPKGVIGTPLDLPQCLGGCSKAQTPPGSTCPPAQAACRDACMAKFPP